MLSFHAAMTKIKKVGGRNFNSCVELFISRRSALERSLDLQADLLQLVSWKAKSGKFFLPSHPCFQGMCLLLQKQSLGSASHCSLASDRWLEPCVNLNRSLLGRHICREWNFSFCQALFFKLFWKLKFCIRDVCWLSVPKHMDIMVV